MANLHYGLPGAEGIKSIPWRGRELSGDLPGSGFPMGGSFQNRSLEKECGQLKMNCRDTRDFACACLDMCVRVDRSLRFPQLHHTNGEHHGRGINILLPRQHFQKGDSLS